MCVRWRATVSRLASMTTTVADGGKGRTPLQHAALDGSADRVGALLRGGAAVDARDSQQETPLHLACWHYNPGTVDVLLKGGASVDVVDAWGNTPLMKAVMSAGGLVQVAVIRRLVAAGADPDRRNDAGRSPRMLASDLNPGALSYFPDTQTMSTRPTGTTIPDIVKHPALLHAGPPPLYDLPLFMLKAYFDERAGELWDCATTGGTIDFDATTTMLRPHNRSSVGVVLYLGPGNTGTVRLTDPASAPAELGEDEAEDLRAIEDFLDIAVNGHATALRVGRGGCIETHNGGRTTRTWQNAWPWPGWRRRAQRIEYRPYR